MKTDMKTIKRQAGATQHSLSTFPLTSWTPPNLQQSVSGQPNKKEGRGGNNTAINYSAPHLVDTQPAGICVSE